MTLEEITDRIRSIAAQHEGRFQETAKFRFEDGIVYLNDTVSPVVVSNEEKGAACTIKMRNEDFEKLLEGNLNVMGAVMSGRLKIRGSKRVAQKLTSLF